MLRKEKERSRIRAVQMDNLRGLLDIRKMDRVPISELCGVMKRVYEKINEGVLRWFGHLERRENDRNAKRVYVIECAGNRSLGRPRKRRIDTG